MRRATWTRTHGRRRALIGASAAVVCLGGVLGACGADGDGHGYVAIGSGGDPSASGAGARPTEGVRLVPLDEPAGRPGDAPGSGGDGSGTDSGSGGDSGSGNGSGPESGEGSGSQGTPGTPGTSGSTASTEGSGSAEGTGNSEGSAPDPQPDPGTPRPTPSPDITPNAPTPSPTSPTPRPPSGSTPAPSPATPAALTAGTPEREPADQRWCEKVTVAFHNSGGTPVRSGTVTFGTHIIGALGVDWATIESTQELPAPIAPGARKEKTWTVCVDAWRVPLGMHVETRDVSVEWE